MDSEGLRRALIHVKKYGCDLPRIDPERIEIDHEGSIGEGGYSIAYRALLDGEKKVCAKLIQETKPKEVVKELKTVDIEGITLPQYGYSYCESGIGRFHICVVNKFCENADLFTFVQKESISCAVKIDVMLQCLKGLSALKRERVVWRDLKGHNMLVDSIERNERGEVKKIKILLNDWGTAAFLPEVGDRRMTLHGPGTIGFIAPDTRSCTYGYQADMWAFNVWAATLCLPSEMVPENEENPPLDWRLEDLQLQKKFTAYNRQEAQVREILAELEHQVLPGCWKLWKLLTSRPWVDPQKRWTCEEALRELEAFMAADASPMEPLRVRNGNRRLHADRDSTASADNSMFSTPRRMKDRSTSVDRDAEAVLDTPSSRRASIIAPEDMRMMHESKSILQKDRVVRKLSILMEEHERVSEEECLNELLSTPAGRRKTRSITKMREGMDVLLGLGFDRKEAMEALTNKDGNLEKAIDTLLL